MARLGRDQLHAHGAARAARAGRAPAARGFPTRARQPAPARWRRHRARPRRATGTPARRGRGRRSPCPARPPASRAAPSRGRRRSPTPRRAARATADPSRARRGPPRDDGSPRRGGIRRRGSPAGAGVDEAVRCPFRLTDEPTRPGSGRRRPIGPDDVGRARPAGHGAYFSAGPRVSSRGEPARPETRERGKPRRPGPHVYSRRAGRAPVLPGRPSARRGLPGNRLPDVGRAVRTISTHGFRNLNPAYARPGFWTRWTLRHPAALQVDVLDGRPRSRS